MDAYEQESLMASSILRRNRHSTIEPYHWFGPDPEPCAAGTNCDCGGCIVRFMP